MEIAKSKLDLVIYGVETTQRVVAITFDDGPNEKYTPQILDLLDRYDAKATFFVVGEAAQKYPLIIKRIAESGHTLANHTWKHSPVPLMSKRERFRQLRDTRDLLKPHGAMLFRPPWGFLSLASYIDVRLLGYKTIFWDVVGFDWLDHSSEEIFEHLDSNIHPGAIVLLHDNIYNTIKPEYETRDSMIAGLEKYLDKHSSIYRFVTVPHLLSVGTPKYKYGLLKKSEKSAAVPDNVL